jgi:hypothetical protein
MQPVLVLKRRAGELHHFAMGRELDGLGRGELGGDGSRMFWKLPIGFL